MSKFSVEKTFIDGVVVIEPRVFEDRRGYFFEAWNLKEFEELGLPSRFVQDNHSRSVKGVVRGLHFQEPYPQGKLVRVVRGEIFDVAVDIRINSPTFGKWFGVILSEYNRKMLYIPEGLAHGFIVISDIADVLYKATEFYRQEYDKGIIWNDPDINIDWQLQKFGIENIILSEKDSKLPTLKEYLEMIG